MNAARKRERERSHCQMLMTCFLQCEWDEDWVGAGGEEGGVHSSERSWIFWGTSWKEKSEKKSHVPAERIQESYLFQHQFLLRTKIASWRVFRLLEQGSKSLGCPVQTTTDCSQAEGLWCIARTLRWHFSSAVQIPRSCKAGNCGVGFPSFCHIDSFVT